jgi:hypothetical protein
MTLSEVLDTFLNETKRRSIFVGLPWYRHLNPIGWFVPSPQFSTAEKLKGLTAAFPDYGSIPLDQLDTTGNNGQPVKFLFTSYDYDRDRANFFRSWPSRAGGVTNPFRPTTVVNAVHAATNAPVKYFDKPAEIGDMRFWDGGVAGYNNPVLAGTVEALAEGWPKDEIAVLSIGTGNVILPLPDQVTPPELTKTRVEPGIASDIEKLALSIISDPPDSHSFIAHVALGGYLPTAQECPSDSTSIVRMNPLIQPKRDSVGAGTLGKWGFPKGLGPDDFKKLVDLDMAAIKNDDVDLIHRFCELWIEGEINNQPIRANRNQDCEIGFAKLDRNSCV